MEITVSSRDGEISPALRTACEEKIGRLARVVGSLDRAEVHFFEEKVRKTPDREVCEVAVEGKGHQLRAKVAAPDRFTAVDRVVTKLEHQVAKLKTKRERRSHPRRGTSVDSRGSHNGLDSGHGRDDDDGGPHVLRSVRSRRFVEKRALSPPQ